MRERPQHADWTAIIVRQRSTEARVCMPRRVIVLAMSAAIFLVDTGCSSTTAPASNSSAPPPPSQTAPVDVSAFVGQWFQHAGDISIQSDGSIDMTYQVERLGAPADFPSLKLKIVSVNGKTAVAQVILSDDPAVPIDSTLTLRRTEPGLAVTFPSGTESDWCDLQHNDQGACGA